MSVQTIDVAAIPRRTIRHYKAASELLAQAGICVNGDKSWAIQVHHPGTFERFLAQGRLGIGESYMDGWWDCDALDEFIHRVLSANLQDRIDHKKMLLPALRARLFNLQGKRRAFEVGEAHYDIGNDLFEAMLDKRMVYTCGYWDGVDTLDEAQERKLDLVCRKLSLEPGMRILDIGCGWGSFGKYAAERYGVKVVGVTVSREQLELGEALCKGLPVTFKLQDYRDVAGEFDHVVSLGMFEHVGYKNYRNFMKVVRSVLKPDGLFLLHTIGGSYSTRDIDPWIGRYIFPNGMLPSIAQIGAATERLFVMEDWHNFGADYDKTLMAWWRNFNSRWHELRDRYGKSFYRMWRYYLLSCAAGFRTRNINLWQIVLSPDGAPGGYVSVR